MFTTLGILSIIVCLLFLFIALSYVGQKDKKAKVFGFLIIVSAAVALACFTYR